jgi:predicted helicase
MNLPHFCLLGTKETKARNTQQMQSIFKTYSPGALSGRDSLVYGFIREELAERIKEFIEDYNVEVSRWARNGRPRDIDNFVHYDRMKWSEHLKDELKRERYGQLNTQSFRISLYRPFCKRWCYYHSLLFDRPGSFDQMFPNAVNEAENCVICVPGVGDRKGFGCFATNSIPSYDLAFEKAQCFPYYTYAEDGTNRRENITDWVLVQFQAKHGSDVTKWDIFHYVYAMLYHPQYRERYAENLKRDLPHIPLLYRKEAFLACVRIGQRLMDIHLHYEQAKEYPLNWIENNDVPFSWRVEKMKLTSDKATVIVNGSLTLVGIPQECFAYRLGNRSALDWVIDQYQVSIDKRSGIVSDPNNLDDEEYIVRLVGKMVTVSVETVRLVNELAQAVKMEDWMSEIVEEN